jgi:subtilisin family serine protease
LVKIYPNLSLLLGTQIALLDVPIGTPLAQMASVPGVSRLEPAAPALTHYGIALRDLGADALAQNSSLPPIMEMTGAARALERSSRGGAGVILLLVDSGVDRSAVAPDRQVGGWTDDPDGDPWTDRTGHGSMVARLASACCPESKIFSVKARASADGGILIESVLSAVDDLLPLIQANRDHLWVMNNSWGYVGCEMDPYW